MGKFLADTMTLVDETLEVYKQKRQAGLEAKAALDALRSRIATLTPAEQTDLVRRVKMWELDHKQAAIKPIKPTVKPLAKPPNNQPALNNCPRCGAANRLGEMFCVNCGNFLGEASPHETRKLADTDALARASDYFGPESTLRLQIPGGDFTYQIQPQRSKHETIIGRSEGSTMKPDIDLSDHNAEKMGVSRLHVALQYNAKNNLLSVSDMKSANGTFINGQKLYPQEVRVLRDGDELRLGRLVLRVFFSHPAEQ